MRPSSLLGLRNHPLLTTAPTAPHPRTHTHTVVFLHDRGQNAGHFSTSLNQSTDSRGQTLANREELQAVGLREVVPALKRLLADEAALLGGRWDRIVLAGISMGAATSVHILFNLDLPDLAGMRSALALPDAPGDDRVLRNTPVRNTPVLLEHCVDDLTVPVDQGRRLWETLRGFGAQDAVYFLRRNLVVHVPSSSNEDVVMGM
ncbi:Alpha/Beta hydrolase protein [Immersiella caudata]|uniref:Alpha/Beta hydrolase protein n=1 Tax=Immersiella caudata TaxID=314043 RepID=A0AA40CCK8_9PEZI|nr:Alpha/Beta hydrolase protein [Immersiella caudata]